LVDEGIMTLLVSWAGVDTHGIASAYIASDSRITWRPDLFFDHCRKVYALRSSPDILGYCGDVLFPSMILSQIVDMADNGLLFNSSFTCKQRFESIKEHLVHQFFRYPAMASEAFRGEFQVLHISRDYHGKDFAGWLIAWRRGSGWSFHKVEFPTASGVLCALGSGAVEFDRNMVRYNNGATHGTSRGVFHCFCDALGSIRDQSCGGAPQLAGIYRKPCSYARTYGIVTRKKRFFLGAELGRRQLLEKIEWRNDLFELCNGRTKNRLANAKSQPDDLRRA
jgi:hypothetical protein